MVEDKQVLIDAEEFLNDDVFEAVSDSSPYCDTTTLNSVPNQTQTPRGLISIVTITGAQNWVKPRPWSRYLPRCGCFRTLKEVLNYHWQFILSAFLTVISASGCLIFFPMHLQNVTEGSEADGYAACFTVTTLTTLLLAVIAGMLKLLYWRSGATVIKPLLSWAAITKIGFSTGLSLLTLFSSWEDHKVLCNFQDPLLGLMFLFAVITHAVSKWKELGYRRSFALLAIAAGVFVSVDYTLVDHHRCRGHYYAHLPKDPWTWDVHLVWTLAFVVSIWLWTVAMFCIENAIPAPQVRLKNSHGEQYNAVKMKVIRVNQNGGQSASTILDEPDLFQNNMSNYSKIRMLKSRYARISYLRVVNAVLWFHLAAWLIIASLFWTEFIPGFGKGITMEVLPTVIGSGFMTCLTSITSWSLIISAVIFSQTFAYLLLLIQSPVISLGISCLGFPVVGVFWSLFQVKFDLFIWMPILSGELVCAVLGFPLILAGCLYLFKLDVLKLDSRARLKSAQQGPGHSQPSGA